MNDLGLFDALRRFDEEYIPFPPFEALDGLGWAGLDGFGSV